MLACDAAQAVFLDAEKHFVALEMDGSSGAVDAQNDVHNVTFAPMSSITDCMASTVVIASMDVTLQVVV